MLKDLRSTTHFLFTQQSLATFANCPLKFKKRYMENLKWNTYPDEQIRKRLEMGNQFHLLAYRYFLGINLGLDCAMEGYDELCRWVDSLKSHFPLEPDTVYLPEYKLRMISGDIKLEANFDLIMLKDGRLEIWDWKTHSGPETGKRLSLNQKYGESLQTMVYLFVLKEQAHWVTGKEVEAEAVSMHYWQPSPPKTVAEIPYTSQMHAAYRSNLERRIEDIYNYHYEAFDKERYSRHCRFCEFNWFCNNDRIDYKAMEETEDLLEGLDWDQVEEKW